MKLHLIRTIANSWSMLGLLIVDDRVFCYTLERTAVAIPAGIYPLTVTYSKRFKKNLPLIGNVEGRSGIRLHGGNRPSDSDGCVLVAYKKKADDWIYQSAAVDLTNLLKDGTHSIKVVQ